MAEKFMSAYTAAEIDERLTQAGEVTGLQSVLSAAFVSGANLTGSNDLNTVTTSGQYRYSGSPANRPGTQTYGVLLVFNPANLAYQGSTTYVVQVAFAAVNASHFNIAATSGVYVRASANGGTAWSEWFKFAFADTSAASIMDVESEEM